MGSNAVGTIGTIMRAFAACLLILAVIAEANAQVRVRGYIKKNGTYVAPHYRSSPNSSRSDNYSTKGSYNPYTGKSGSTNLYPASSYPSNGYQSSYSAPTMRQTTTTSLSSASALSWSRYKAPKPPALARGVALPSSRVQEAPRTVVTSVYRCVNTQRVTHYISYPRAGCSEVQVEYQQQAAAQPPLTSYRQFPCTSDCSGHEAGYAWARSRGIDDPDDCGGNSQSFVEGCQTYAEEQQD